MYEELVCRHCSTVFPANHLHECDYHKLKADNKRMREALNSIVWTLPATNPQSWAFKEIARNGLYGDKKGER